MRDAKVIPKEGKKFSFEKIIIYEIKKSLVFPCQ